MASASIGIAERPSAGERLLDRVAAQGSAAHDWSEAEALLAGAEAARNLADLIHYLCVLHGRYPGVLDHALGHVAERGARAWLTEAAYGFAGERAYLARLAVAAGPVPSTPGAADSDAAVLGQRQALELLSRSERTGCALGAAMAVVLDWAAIRCALDAAARRFAVEVPPFPSGDAERIAAVADAFAPAPPVQRALLFGAEQILVQHYGLWDLLEARAAARTTADG